MTIDSNDLCFSWIFPYDQEQYLLFDEVKERILNVLLTGYGAKSIPAQNHLRRLANEKYHLCYVSFRNETNKIIACSYVREDGKRGATTVLPEYRNSGIGKALVMETLTLIPNQIGEVGSSNECQIRLLMKCGFTPVKTKDEIISSLGDLANFIVDWIPDYWGMSYKRISVEIPNLVHVFYLLKSTK